MLDMEPHVFKLYWDAITVIEAQEALLGIQVAAYPHLKTDDQKGLHRNMHRMAYPEDTDDKVLTTQDFARILTHGK